MNKTYRSFATAALLGASTLSLTVGCGGSKTPDQASAEKAPAAEQQTTQTGTQAGTLADPTFQPKVVETTDSEAQKTVAMFLDSLRRGDEATANSTLTALARNELKKTNYVIQPLGTPDGQYFMGRLGYPYQDKTVALVECQWREPATAKEPELVMDIVCEVHQEADGWKIAGMAVTVAGENEPLVIDFEDGQRLQQMLDMANGQAPAGQPVSQPNMQPGNGTQAGQIAAPGQLPSLQNPQMQNQPGQLPPSGVQFGQLPQLQSPQQPGGAPNLNAPPQLPNQQQGSGTQTANPPGGNVLR